MKGAVVFHAWLFALFCWLTPLDGYSQDETPGRVDTSFEVGSGFRNLTGASLLGAQSTGKILVGSGPGGGFESINGYGVTNLARLNTNGILDTSFKAVLRSGSGPATIEQLLVLPDDRILVTGTFDSVNGHPIYGLARLGSDGGLDPTFARNVLDPADGGMIAPAAGGKLLVRSATPPRLRRLLTDGSIDQTFMLSNLLDVAYGFAEQADGSLLVVGKTTGPISLFHFRPDGSHDPEYHSPSFAPASTPSDPPQLALQNDGKVLVGGTFTNVDGLFRGSIVRLDPSGAVDTSFLPGRRGLGAAQIYQPAPRIAIAQTRTIKAIGIQEDGRIVVVGNFATFDGIVVNGVTRMNTNGSRDLTFLVGKGATIGSTGAVVNGLTIDRRGFLVVAGGFDQVNELRRDGLARLHGRLVPPAITIQPTNQTVPISTQVTFGFTGVGSQPMHYQWKRRGKAIPGATGAVHQVRYVLDSDSDTYSVAMTNAVGWATSQVCRLTVAGVPAGGPTGQFSLLFVYLTGRGIVAGLPEWPVRKQLEIGRSYTIEAWPRWGARFVNWGGHLFSTNQRIHIVTTSNLWITVNFMEDPHQTRSGGYTGVFYNTNGLESGPYGTFAFTMNELGRFSSRWTLPGRSIHRVGQFDLGLYSEITLLHDSGSNGPMEVKLSILPETDQVTGTMSDGVHTSQLRGYRKGYRAGLAAARFAGHYTAALSGSEEPGAGPVAQGFGSITVRRDGSVSFRGALSDGTPVTHSIHISGEADWPMLIPMPNRRGVLLGWLRMSESTAHDIDGSLVWARAPRERAEFYPDGFTNSLTVQGSRYDRDAARAEDVSFTNGVVVLEQGNLQASLTNSLLPEPNRSIQVAPPNPEQIDLALNSSSGWIRGSFTHPQTLQRTRIRGVMLQKQHAGVGFFVGTNRTGSFYLGEAENLPLFTSPH